MESKDCHKLVGGVMAVPMVEDVAVVLMVVPHMVALADIPLYII